MCVRYGGASGARGRAQASAVVGLLGPAATVDGFCAHLWKFLRKSPLAHTHDASSNPSTLPPTSRRSGLPPCMPLRRSHWVAGWPTLLCLWGPWGPCDCIPTRVSTGGAPHLGRPTSSPHPALSRSVREHPRPPSPVCGSLPHERSEYICALMEQMHTGGGRGAQSTQGSRQASLLPGWGGGVGGWLWPLASPLRRTPCPAPLPCRGP